MGGGVVLTGDLNVCGSAAGGSPSTLSGFEWVLSDKDKLASAAAFDTRKLL